MAFPTNSTIIDTFDGTGNVANPPWNARLQSGNDVAETTSGLLFNNGSGDFADGTHQDDYGPNVELYMDVSTVGANADYAGLHVRVNSPGTSGVDAYSFYVQKAAGTDNWEVYELTNNSFSLLASATQEIANGEKWGGWANSSDLKMYHYTGGSWNQTPIVSTTDGTITAAGKIAFDIEDNVWRLDNIGGGTEVVGGASTHHLHLPLLGVG